MSVIIEKSPLWTPIQDILDNGNVKLYNYIFATIHTEKMDILIPKLRSIDVRREYQSAIGDEMYLKGIVGFGDYVKDIYPYRNNLEISLRYMPVNMGGEYKGIDDIPSTRYKAIFLAEENPTIDTNDYLNVDRHTLNVKSIEEISFQLVDRSLEPLRVMTCGGVYKDTSNADIVSSITADVSTQADIEGSPAIDAIDIIEADNQDTRETTIIPQETLLIDLPAYIQNKEGGLYNAGVGNYLQTYNNKTTWFIYPLYNNKRFESSEPDKAKLVIYAVPSARFFSATRTYKVDGNIIYILGGCERVTKDDGESRAMSDGIGFKNTDANAIMEKPITITDDGPEASRRQLTTEVKFKEKEDGIDLTPVSESKVSSNLFKESSKVVLKTGMPLVVEWPYGDPNLLYPAMPIKFVYIDDVDGNMDRIEVYGTLLSVTYTTQQSTKGWASRHFTTIVGLGMFIDKIDSKSDTEETTEESPSPPSTETKKSTVDKQSAISEKKSAESQQDQAKKEVNT